MSIHIGVDVGGTKIEVALLKEESAGDLHIQDKNKKQRVFRVIERERTPTERSKGYDHIVDKICTLLTSACKSAAVELAQIESIGFGLPGSIRPTDKKMINGNTLVLVGKNLAADVKAKLKAQLNLKCGFYSENDANCFTLAESLCGVGRKHFESTGKNFRETISIGVILGTGCGGGIVICGQMVRGRDGGAGEIGHMVFDPEGPPCYCGRRGCPEQYLSGPGLEAMFAVRKYSGVRDVFSAKEIFEQASLDEPVASAVVQSYKKILARFLGSLNSIFNPDYFVLGGGVSQQAVIYRGLEQEALVNSYVKSSPVKVYQSQLGDSSGVIGAAFLPFVD